MNTFSPHEARRARRCTTGVFVAVAVVAVLVAAVPAQASRRSPTAARCTVIAHAAPWTIRGFGSGTAYKVVAVGMSCAVAQTWVRKLTHLKGSVASSVGVFRGGPAGFTCHSFSIGASGDKLIYAGACAAPHGHPFFGWAAKTA